MQYQDRMVRIGQHVLHKAVAAFAFGIGKAVKDAIALRVFDQMVQIPLFLVAKGFTVGYQELQIACVWLINMRVVNLVYDPVTQGKPEPATGMVGRAYAFFCARTPAWLDSGSTERYCVVRWIHI